MTTYAEIARSMTRKEMIAYQALMEAKESARRVYVEEIWNRFYPTSAEPMKDSN